MNVVRPVDHPVIGVGSAAPRPVDFAETVGAARAVAEVGLGRAAVEVTRWTMAEPVAMHAAPSVRGGLLDGIATGTIALPASIAALIGGDVPVPDDGGDPDIFRAPTLLVCEARATQAIVPLRSSISGRCGWGLVAIGSDPSLLDRRCTGRGDDYSLALLRPGGSGIPIGTRWETARVADAAVADLRLLLARVALDAAWRGMEDCLDFGRSRAFGGGTLFSYQAVRHRLAEMRAAAEIAEANVAGCIKARTGFGECSAATAAGVCACALRATSEIAEQARQLLGGRGFLLENRVASLGLDLTTLQLFTGPLSALEIRASGPLWTTGVDPC